MTDLRQRVQGRLFGAVRGRRETDEVGPRHPPRVDVPLDELEKADRTALLRLRDQHGPIFSGTSFGEPYVCIVGLSLARRFVQLHAESVTPFTIDITSLVPLGMVRQMEGEAHLEHRRALVRASKSLDPIVNQAVLDAIVGRALDALVDDELTSDRSPLLAMAFEAATAALVALFYGAQPSTELFEDLVQGHRRLGPYGLAWSIKQPQFDAFADLIAALRAGLERRNAGDGSIVTASVLAQLEGAGNVDDSMLGNLIYMVEMGRQDLQVFFRWIIHHAAANPDGMGRIATQLAAHVGPPNESPAATSLTEGFVLEVLRHDQTERLVRTANVDLAFEGFVIPKGTHVRLCMWESHHADEVFTDPLRFDPDRFLGPTPGNDQYAPFGIDHHQCPFGSLSIRLGATLVRALATTHAATTLSEGRPVRGPYHWEPSRQLKVKVVQR